MKPHLLAGATVLALSVPTLALAQQSVPIPESPEATYARAGVAAPTKALELTVGSGYTQGFGEFRSGTGMPQIARAGVGVDGNVGYRIDPHWGVSVGGQYQELEAQNADATRGAAFTLAVQYHASPTVRVDPWIELGTGYRLLWQLNPEDRGNNVLTHGFQLARARAGIDIRVSPEVAIAPVIGADATTFLWQDGADRVTIPEPSVSAFVFAGLQGRFDIGGTKVGTTALTSASR